MIGVSSERYLGMGVFLLVDLVLPIGGSVVCRLPFSKVIPWCCVWRGVGRLFFWSGPAVFFFIHRCSGTYLASIRHLSSGCEVDMPRLSGGVGRPACGVGRRGEVIGWRGVFLRPR